MCTQNWHLGRSGFSARLLQHGLKPALACAARLPGKRFSPGYRAAVRGPATRFKFFTRLPGWHDLPGCPAPVFPLVTRLPPGARLFPERIAAVTHAEASYRIACPGTRGCPAARVHWGRGIPSLGSISLAPRNGGIAVCPATVLPGCPANFNLSPPG